MSIKKCVIYTRVSTVDQAEFGFSLDAQRKACEEYAEREKYEVNKIYIERGESAKTADRTEFKKMIHYVIMNFKKISAIIIWKYDRFSRNLADLIAYREKLNEKGIKLLSVTENSADTPDGILIANILGSLSQYENELKSERTVTGMTEAAAKGHWLWRPPFGYKLIKKELVVDDEAAQVVRDLFNYYIQSQSFERCKDFLKKKGVRKSSWIITKVLRNPVYIGMITTKLMDHPVQGKHEPIVSKDIFEKVQHIINNIHKKHSTPRRKKFDPRFYLRGFLYCDKCGTRITASMSKGRSKQYGFYRCPNNCFYMKSDDLHEFINDVLSDYEFNDEVVEKLEKTLKDFHENHEKYKIKEIKNLKQKLTKLETRKSKLLDLLIDGTLDEESYKAKGKEIDSDIEVKKYAISRLEEKMVEIDKLIEKVRLLIQSPKSLSNRLQPADRLRVMYVLFPEGIKVRKSSYRTPLTTPILRHLRDISRNKSQMVTPRGIEPLLQE